MSFLDRIRNRPDGEGDEAVAATDAGSPDEHDLPLAHYDKLDPKKVIGQLHQHSQVELAAIESHERSHGARPVVLNKLHWLRGSEPLSGYDALETGQVVAELGRADAATVKAIREYEHKFQGRKEIEDEIARVLPTSALSVGEERAIEEKAERVGASVRPKKAGQD